MRPPMLYLLVELSSTFCSSGAVEQLAGLSSTVSPPSQAFVSASETVSCFPATTSMQQGAYAVLATPRSVVGFIVEPCSLIRSTVTVCDAPSHLTGLHSGLLEQRCNWR